MITVKLTQQEIEHIIMLISSIIEIEVPSSDGGLTYTLAGDFDAAMTDGKLSILVYDQIKETLSNNTSRCIIANPPHDNYNYDEVKFHPPVMIVEDINLKAGDVVSFLKQSEQHNLNCDELVKLRYPQSYVERGNDDK